MIAAVSPILIALPAAVPILDLLDDADTEPTDGGPTEVCFRSRTRSSSGLVVDGSIEDPAGFEVGVCKRTGSLTVFSDFII